MSCSDEPDTGESVHGGVELSAVVMLRPGQFGEATPDQASTQALRTKFMRLGFDVGPAVAISFAISGSDALFDEVFPSAAPVLDSFRPDSGRSASQGEVALPIDDLRPPPSSLRDDGRWARNEESDESTDEWTGIGAIFFPERPDFGPGNP